MTHQEAQQDTIERFVRHQLSTDERRAFEEHYFECEECFEQVQTMARFVAGIRQAARKGLLTESVVDPWWAILSKPALMFATAIALLLAVGIGWLLLKQRSAPHQELAIEQTPTPQTKTSIKLTPTPFVGENRKPDLLAHNRSTQPPEPAPGKSPIVFLSSERGDSNSNPLKLPANAESVILRIDVEPSSTFSSFQFQVFDSAKHQVATINSGKATTKGIVSASLPAKLLQTGKYVVKCFGLRGSQRELVGEYRLEVLKP